MKDYDKNIASSYLKCWDVNNWFAWVMSQKLPVDGFKRIWKKTSQFNVLQKSIIKIFWKNEGYFVEVDVQYLEKLHDLHNDLQRISFLLEKMKIENFEKPVANLNDK